ncbi:MAG: FprA family A-type flavoprotein [Clostridia bacterium]
MLFLSCIKIRDNIYYVGSEDFDVRMFHGYLVPFGTTYNAYLVIDEKITLIDFVKAQFTDDLIANIESVIPLEKIDCMICNHVEPDHSGALPAIAERIPDVPIYATAAAKRGLSAYYKRDFNIVPVKLGDTLCTGKYTFSFIPMPMVHWPDSMCTYLELEKILFSNDAFGQHLATRERFDDEIGKERLLERAGNYYANIVLPFGTPVQKVLAQAATLDIKMICPSHGVILRSFIPEMLEKYTYWAKNESDPNRAVVAFDTMWGATRILAGRICDDLTARGITPTLIDLSDTHPSVAIAAALEAGVIAVGSPTLNRNVMPSVAAFLTYMKGLAPKNRVGLAFGSYGWSGESIPQIEAVLRDECGFTLLPSVKSVYMP